MVFELRTYHAVPGKMPELLDRYERTTIDMLPDFAMEAVGHWVSTEDPDTYIYIVKHNGNPEKAWQNFVDDPRWAEAVARTEVDGPLLERIESVFLEPAKFSPIQ